MSRRPWRRCSACWGVCYWHDTDWVCSDTACGSEWNEGFGPRYAAPGGTTPTKTRLGTVTEARDALGLIDGAEVWERVADGKLDATHEDPASSTWTIWAP